MHWRLLPAPTHSYFVNGVTNPVYFLRRRNDRHTKLYRSLEEMMQRTSQSNMAVARPERRKLLRGLLAGGAMLLAAPIVAACGGAQPQVQTAPKTGAQTGAQTSAKAETKAGATTVTVEMNDQNKFVPETVTVKKGATVTWKNSGMMVHNIVTDPNLAVDKSHARVPDGAKIFTSPMVNAGGTWSHTFDVAGEYTYFCQPHEALGMVGKVVVTE